MLDSRGIQGLPYLDGVLARITSIEDYKAELARRIRKGMVAKELPQSGPLYASIDCGFWCVPRCECGSGIALNPDWQYAACFHCGRTWTDVRFPDAAFMEAIDRVLILRPRTAQVDRRTARNPMLFYSWWSGETVDDLILENRRRGWPVPEAA